MSSDSARLVELFSAIQGEGLNVGTRQIFVRFAHCDLRCHFCDSVNTWIAPETCQIERSPGLRDFETHPNPVSLPDLLDWVDRHNPPNLHDSISITGGEPLLHASFLAEFLPAVFQRTQLPIYLETGGHRPEQLQQVLPYLHLIGMDWKLPSVSGEDHFKAHHQFLQLAHQAQVPIFVKIIIAEQMELIELKEAAELIRQVSPAIAVFLQPVTQLEHLHPDQTIMYPPRPDQVLAWQGLLKQQLRDVRVIPQTHKFINQL